MLKTVKELVAGSTSKFLYYQDGNLWYGIGDGHVGDDYTREFTFPIPISDCGSARFLDMDKSIIFMRWIRKQHELLKQAVNQIEIILDDRNDL